MAAVFFLTNKQSLTSAGHTKLKKQSSCSWLLDGKNPDLLKLYNKYKKRMHWMRKFVYYMGMLIGAYIHIPGQREWGPGWKRIPSDSSQKI